MVSFTPTQEQDMLVTAIRRYAENNLQKYAHENDETGTIPHELLLKGWEIGLLPASIPEDYGGFGDHSAVTNVLALEELAYGDLSAAMKLMVPALFAYPIQFFGTEEQKARFLPLFCEEKPYPATAALVEPCALFDPHDLNTTAMLDGDVYLLNGEKTMVPLAQGSEWMLIYAREDDAIGGFLVETASEGVQIQGREKLMGLNALETYRVIFNQVRVPLENKLPELDYQKLLNHSNIALAALAVGVARASHEYALNYAKNRVQFGKPIATKQAIAFMLAEGRIEVDSAHLLVLDAAWQLDAGKSAEEITKAAYLARHYADKAVLFVTDCGVQILGGYGFIREYPVERYLRNGRGFPAFTGLAIV
jgi:acyl-CoA dehydrogenase